MGAGLAAQHGWGHDNVHSPTDPDSPSGDAEASPKPNMSKFVTGGDNQPLDLGSGWINYQSTDSTTSLVEEHRRLRQGPDQDSVEQGTEDNIFEDDEVEMKVREERLTSVAYDLGSISTENEIQRRFAFRESGRYNLAEVFGKAKRKVTKPLRSPVALLYYLLPITRILKSYSRENLAKDALVGITMATLMIPQGLAFATVSGIPLLYGLYIVWVPPFFYSLFGVSIHVSYGPFALIGLFLNDAMSKRGFRPCDGLCRHETEEVQAYLEACTIVTFMVSIWYFIMAALKLGEPLAILLADPVISGFVTASALLVADSQICTFFQIHQPEGGNSGIIGTLSQVWIDRESINWVSTATGVSAMLVYFALRHFNAYIKSRGSTAFVPEALTVVILCTFVSWTCDLSGNFDVDIVGDIPPGLPTPKFPRLDMLNSLEAVEDFALVSLVAAIVSFIITHSIAKSLAGATEIKATPQLFAFGVANLAGAMFSTFPSSASLSRAAIIDTLGARTILHNVFTFLIMTFVLLFFSPSLEYLPTTVLAATIFAVIYKFFNFWEPVRLYRVGIADSVMWIATFAATLGLSVKKGIVVGMAVSAFTLIKRSAAPLVMQLGRLPGTTFFRDIKKYSDAQRTPGIEVMRFGASLTFANKDLFRRWVMKLVEKSDYEARVAEKQGLPKKTPLQYLILDSASIHDLDSSSLRSLEGLVRLLMEREPPIEILLAPVSDPLMRQIHKSPGLCATLGRRYFISIAHAVGYATEQIASGPLLAPDLKTQPIWSSVSLANLDEDDIHDI